MSGCLRYLPALIADKVSTAKRLLLFGESGSGKSTLAADLANLLDTADRPCFCLSADPGSPAFGVPGAVCLGRWHGNGWQLLGMEALCSLDAGRFRLPLVAAVRHLVREAPSGLLLVDAPGIVRSVAGSELLTGLVDAAAIDTVLVLTPHPEKPPLANELATLGREILLIHPSDRAHPPGKNRRTKQRSLLWNTYLEEANIVELSIQKKRLLGTPPPWDAFSAWQGRQIALLKQGKTLAMGEVLSRNTKKFTVRIAASSDSPDQYLVRDCFRNVRGLLSTFKPAFLGKQRSVPPDAAIYPSTTKDTGPQPILRIGDATAALINGVFGDPLLHLRLHNKKRSLLFDLGEGGRLPARLAHQVSDVFISHAHIDHISGFLWLLRSRIGMARPCRLFGPPGLSDRIFSLINGILWDRIEANGPRFEVHELHGDRLLVFGLQAGNPVKVPQGERPAQDGLLFTEPDCKVRSVTLMHGDIPVVAYCLELAPKLNVSKKNLMELGLAAGPWLGELKKRILAAERQAKIKLPDGSEAAAGTIADSLLQVTPARKLVYATDLSNNRANREKLVDLAQGAHLLFCETAFLAADHRYATLSGHLTAQACAEIAREARVELVVPFHFSRRYENNRHQVYAEVGAVYKRVWREGN